MCPPPPSRSARTRRAAISLVLALLASGCGATPDENLDDATPYIPPPPKEPESLGYFLAQLDKSLQRWTELKLAARSQRERRTLEALEASLEKRAKERQDDLVAVLETGAPNNRQVAAVALGFTHDPGTLSTLLGALSDPDEEVVQKALLGIGILALPDTPLSQIEYLLIHHPDAWTRNNAAYALQAVVAAGARPEDIGLICQQALLDEEPGVRAQAASVLGILEDEESIARLGTLLEDEVPLVVAASAMALARIGQAHPASKGECARLLVEAMERAEKDDRRLYQEALVRLADRNLGEGIEPWKDWAYRMP